MDSQSRFLGSHCLWSAAVLQFEPSDLYWVNITSEQGEYFGKCLEYHSQLD